jgi:hypothetical protein
VDDVLAQAHNVSSSLLEQRRVFDSVSEKLVTVGDRFPAVAGLLNAIRRKKSRVGGCRARCLPASPGAVRAQSAAPAPAPCS